MFFFSNRHMIHANQSLSTSLEKQIYELNLFQILRFLHNA